jgi:putative oxidoreductase
MAAFMERHQGWTFAVLRVVAGLLFLCHGLDKLVGWPVEMPAGMEMPAYITYVAGPIEVGAGALVAIGLFTRWAAFLASGQMAFAYWLGHGKSAFVPVWKPLALIPDVNHGEIAVLYCFLFLFISAHGAGTWSVDAGRGRS